MTDSGDRLPAADPIARDADRVRAEYQRRADDSALREYYQRIGPAVRRANQARRMAVLEVLDSIGPREGLRILDAGCGLGADLEYLAQHGFEEDHLAGVDIFGPAIDEARDRLPRAEIVLGNLAQLAFPSSIFDAVTQTTVLSSVVDPQVQEAIGAEILRVLKPGGLLISYDLVLRPRDNPNLVSVFGPDVRRIFAGAEISRMHRMTLTYSIAQRVPDLVARVLERIPWLNGYLFAIGRKSNEVEVIPTSPNGGHDDRQAT